MQAVIGYFTIISPAYLFKVVMFFIDSFKASSLAIPTFEAVVTIPVPKDLVHTRISPVSHP